MLVRDLTNVGPEDNLDRGVRHDNCLSLSEGEGSD